MNITEYPNLPQNAEAWAQAFAAEFTRWTNVRTNDVGRIIVNALEAAPSLDEISDDQVNEYILRPMHNETGYHSGYGSNRERSEDDERVVTWLLGIIEDATSPDDEDDVEATSEAKPGEPTVEEYLEKMLPNLPQHLNERGHTAKYGQIVNVMTYQFTNWKAGKRRVLTTDKAVAQFNRRMSREYGWTTTGLYDNRLGRMVNHALSILRKVAVGESVLIMPMQPTQEEIQTRFATEYEDLYRRVDGYYLGYVGYRVSTAWRRAGEPWSAGEFHDKWVSDMRDYCSREISERYTKDDTAVVYDLLVQMTFGQAGQAEPDESVTDYESLVTWMIGLHEDAGSLQQDAIRDGLADWFDTVRDDPERVEKEGVVETMRRQVMAYGFTRFTGKAIRPVLRATLAVVFEKHKGEGLTLDEWKTRWARRDKAVSYVSGRYGEEQNLCSVLEKATTELGILPTRKPKHKIRFEGSGVLVEVEVESWMDDQHKLQRSATEAWEKMTPAQKEAAIVKRTEVYVNWSDMKVAR